MLMSTSYACSYIYPLKPSSCVISIVKTCWPLMHTSNVYNYGYTCPWCNFTTISPAFSLSWDSHNLSMYRPAFFQVYRWMHDCMHTSVHVCLHQTCQMCTIDWEMYCPYKMFVCNMFVLINFIASVHRQKWHLSQLNSRSVLWPKAPIWLLNNIL